MHRVGFPWVSSGSYIPAHEKYRAQGKDQREGSSVQVFRKQSAATGGPRKHSLLLFLHTEQKPSTRGDIITLLPPGPGQVHPSGERAEIRLMFLKSFWTQ